MNYLPDQVTLMNNKLLLGIVLLLSGLIGALLPQHFSSTQRLPALFFFADEQLNIGEGCSSAAQGVYPSAIQDTPTSCEFVARVRYAYDGLTYPAALHEFKTGLRQDQLVFASLLGLSGLLAFLTFFAYSKIHKKI